MEEIRTCDVRGVAIRKQQERERRVKEGRERGRKGGSQIGCGGKWEEERVIQERSGGRCGEAEGGTRSGSLL